MDNRKKIVRLMGFLLGFIIAFVALMLINNSAYAESEMHKGLTCAPVMTCTDSTGKLYFITWNTAKVEKKKHSYIVTFTDSEGHKHKMNFLEKTFDSCSKHCLVGPL